MNHKILITISLIIGSLAMSCINSNQKQQSKTNVIQKNPVEQVFKEISSSNKTLEELLKNDIIKERIIRDYSNNFYDKLLNYMQILGSSIVTYEQGMYKCNAIGMGIYYNHTINCSYSPSYDELNIEFKIDGRKVQSNGELYYNTEGWEIQYPKDEFDEDITSQPVLHYSLFNNEGVIPYNPIWINIIPFKVEQNSGILCILCTNKLGYSSSNIAKILIKDNKSGKVYNIAFDKLYNEEYSGFRYADVGVSMFYNTFIKFMNIITELTDYTISFINEEGENAVIKNPKNLCNICDAFDKFIEDYKKIK